MDNILRMKLFSTLWTIVIFIAILYIYIFLLVLRGHWFCFYFTTRIGLINGPTLNFNFKPSSVFESWKYNLTLKKSYNLYIF